MKIEYTAPRDQLEKYLKTCSTRFWVFLILGVFTVPFGIVLIVFAFYFRSQKKKAAEVIRQQDVSASTVKSTTYGGNFAERYSVKRQAELDAWNKFLEENIVVREIHTKVAGVTFLNDDGSSRQDVLADACPGESVVFDHFTYQGAPAYSVSYCGRQIGNLPADLARDLYELDDNYTFVGEIDAITGGYDSLKYGCNLLITLYRHK